MQISLNVTSPDISLTPNKSCFGITGQEYRTVYVPFKYLLYKTFFDCKIATLDIQGLVSIIR